KELERLGCGQGTRIGIVFGNCIEYFVSFFAISAAGSTIVPLSERMTDYEIAGYLADADVSVVVTGPKQKIQGGGTLSAVVEVSYDVDGSLVIESSVMGQCHRDGHFGEVALMVPTSGTTGRPKMVMLTDGQLISNMAIYRFVMGFDEGNIVYCVLALCHIYCICAQMLTHISLGDTFVLTSDVFFAKDFLSAVERHGVTVTALVPYMASLLVGFGRSDKYDLSSLKYVTLSGARTPAATYEELCRKYSTIRFVNTYGMSEAGSRISIAAGASGPFPSASVGKPMPGISVKIVNENFRRVPAGAVGQIMVKSSGIMKGYYKQAELTRRVVRNGWLCTGDLGRIDFVGNLFIEGRSKDIILSGGENISPFEVEQCLIEHPAIVEAVVVGKQDRLLQEVPFAFVVSNGHHRQPIVSEIIRFCRRKLSSHKIPRIIRFVDSLPRLANCKIDRKQLEQMAKES
ncbi:MAG: class I adenylate-forming enzyme family protein, partial [Planctomycetota bacterium]